MDEEIKVLRDFFTNHIKRILSPCGSSFHSSAGDAHYLIFKDLKNNLMFLFISFIYKHVK